MVAPEHFFVDFGLRIPLFVFLYIYNQHSIFMSKNIRAEIRL